MPRLPVTFGRATRSSLSRATRYSRAIVSVSSHVVSVPGSMSTRAYDGSSGDAAVDVHGWISKPAKLAAQTSAGAPSISRYSRVSPVLARGFGQRRTHSGAWAGTALW